MTDATETDAGYDEWLDAIESGEAYYLRCPNGHGWLPPRRVCPDCGATDLAEHSLPDTGEIETFTVLHVATPRFDEEVPYVTAIADFGDVRLTGVLRGIETADVTTGLSVEPVLEATETDGEPVLVFRPAN